MRPANLLAFCVLVSACGGGDDESGPSFELQVDFDGETIVLAHAVATKGPDSSLPIDQWQVMAGSEVVACGDSIYDFESPGLYVSFVASTEADGDSPWQVVHVVGDQRLDTGGQGSWLPTASDDDSITWMVELIDDDLSLDFYATGEIVAEVCPGPGS